MKPLTLFLHNFYDRLYFYHNFHQSRRKKIIHHFLITFRIACGVLSIINSKRQFFEWKRLDNSIREKNHFNILINFKRFQIIGDWSLVLNETIDNEWQNKSINLDLVLWHSKINGIKNLRLRPCFMGNPFYSVGAPINKVEHSNTNAPTFRVGILKANCDGCTQMTCTWATSYKFVGVVIDYFLEICHIYCNTPHLLNNFEGLNLPCLKKLIN